MFKVDLRLHGFKHFILKFWFIFTTISRGDKTWTRMPHRIMAIVILGITLPCDAHEHTQT